MCVRALLPEVTLKSSRSDMFMRGMHADILGSSQWVVSELIPNLLETTVGKRKISDRVIKGVKNTVKIQ